MREILFRGKSVEDGEWRFGYHLKRPSFSDSYPRSYIYEPPELAGELGQWEAVVPETVGQFTGLTDKNGKKIFEGDIVHYLYEPGKGYWNSDQNSVIEWRSTGFFMRGIMGTNKYACSTGWLVSTPHGDGKCFEVIGTIHDNPELLEGGAEDGK